MIESNPMQSSCGKERRRSSRIDGGIAWVLWSGPRRRYTSLAVERRVCAAAAAQRPYVSLPRTLLEAVQDLALSCRRGDVRVGAPLIGGFLGACRLAVDASIPSQANCNRR